MDPCGDWNRCANASKLASLSSTLRARSNNRRSTRDALITTAALCCDGLALVLSLEHALKSR